MISKYPDSLDWESTMVQYGRGLFETMLFRDGRLNFFEEHMQRLAASSKTLNIGTKYLSSANQNILDHISCFEESCLDGKTIVKLTVSDSGYAVTTRAIPYQLQDYEEGLMLCVYPFHRGYNQIYQHKTTSYMENLLSAEYARERGYHSSVFLDSQDCILETSYANIFFFSNGSFIFPPEKNLLAGIMQKNIKRIFKLFGYNFQERRIYKGELNDFEGAFLCNSVMEMMPVKSIDDHSYQVFSDICARINRCIREKSINKVGM